MALQSPARALHGASGYERGPVAGTGRISALELIDFKSYCGAHVIGPFYPFSCVIGPNGAGKSNLVDAVLFVLGSPARELRCERLSQLINSKSGADCASVTLIFERPASQGSGRASSTRFTRVIHDNNTSSYRVDGADVLWKEYNSKLESFSVMTNSKNYLVQQHEVTRLSLKTPRELTDVFERISGSGELKKEYEEAKTLADSAAAEHGAVFKKKRVEEQEVALLQAQRSQAEVFQRLSARLDRLAVARELVRLVALEVHDIRGASDRELGQLQAELKRVEQIEEKGVQRRNEIKRQRTRLQKELSKVEQKMLSLGGQTADMTPDMVQLKERLANTQNQLKVYERNLARSRELLVKQQASAAELEADLVRTRQERDTFLRTVSAADGADVTDAAAALEVSEDVRRQQESLQEAASVRTAALRQALSIEQRLLEKDEAALAHCQERASRLAAEIRTVEDRRHTAAEQLEQCQEQLAARGSALVRLDAETKREAEKRNHLENLVVRQRERLRLLDQRVAECRSAVREGEHARTMREALTAMQGMFRSASTGHSAVRGRLVDMTRVPVEALRPAVAALMGQYLEAVVVDDARTARECISYLRDQRIGSMTFLPLESITAPTVARRSLPPNVSARLALDVVEFDPAVEKAVVYALGSSLICDTLDDARELAWFLNGGSRARGSSSAAAAAEAGGPTATKIACLDGSIVHRNGNISGGLAHVEQRGMKWDQAELQRLRTSRDALRKELDEAERSLRSISAVGLEEQQQQDWNALDAAQKQGLKEEQSLQRRIADADRELAGLQEKRQSTIDPELAHLQGLVVDRQRTVAQKESEIAAVERSVFGTSYVAHKSLVRKMQERQKRLLEFENLIARIENQLEFVRRSNHVSAADKWSLAATEAREAIAAFEARSVELEAKNVALQEELRGLEKEHEEMKTRVTDMDSELRSATSDDRLQQRETAALKKRISAIEDRLTAARQQRLSIVERCRIEGLALPIISGDDGGDMADDDFLGKGADSESDTDGAAEMVDVGESRAVRSRSRAQPGRARAAAVRKQKQRQLSRAGAGGRQPSRSRVRRFFSELVEGPDGTRFRIDFSSLYEDLDPHVDAEDDGDEGEEENGENEDVTIDELEKAAPEAFAKRLDWIEARMKKVVRRRDAVSMSSMQGGDTGEPAQLQQQVGPNLKAGEQLKVAEARLRQTMAVLEDAKRHRQEADERFRRVQRERVGRFLAAFEPVRSRINDVYCRLTADDAAHPTGGYAYLGVEVPDEPYLGGIKFNCTPPGKRIAGDLANRSGGEKTVSALALLLSLHAFQPSPFFVFDEIDAALDPVNVHKVVQFVRGFTHEATAGEDLFSGTQCIVISHKESFFQKADALVGVCRDLEAGSSKVLTLDLTQYDA